MLVTLFAMLVGRCRVLFGLIVLALLMGVSSFQVMVSSRLMLCSRLVVVVSRSVLVLVSHWCRPSGESGETWTNVIQAWVGNPALTRKECAENERPVKLCDYH